MVLTMWIMTQTWMMTVLNNFIYIHSYQIKDFHISLSYMLYFLMPCCICFPLNSSKWIWRWCSWWHARRWIYTRKLGFSCWSNARYTVFFKLTWCLIKLNIFLWLLFIALDYWDIGDLASKCEQCGAMMWYDERIQKHYNPKKPRFSLCCMDGKVELPQLKRPPDLLMDLFHKKDKRSKYFLDHIRSFNMMFSFTSLGGKINTSMNDGNAPPMFIMNGENYHQMGSLLPQDGSQPKFAQLYIYDTNNEVANRMSVVGYNR